MGESPYCRKQGKFIVGSCFTEYPHPPFIIINRGIFVDHISYLQNAHAILFEDINVYDILKYDTLLLTKDAVGFIEKKIRDDSLGKNGRELLQTQEQVRISKENNLHNPQTELARYYSNLAHHVKEIEENPHLLVEAAEAEKQTLTKKKKKLKKRTLKRQSADDKTQQPQQLANSAGKSAEATL